MNLGMLLDMAADCFGERVIIGTRGEGITATRLRAKAAASAQYLAQSGADAIVYVASNGPAFPLALFAAAREGVPLVPLNYRLGEEQLNALLSNHERALGIAGRPEQAAAMRRAGLATLSIDEWLALGDDTPDPTSAPDETLVEGNEPALIIYTSGSTSAPKGVVLRHHNLVSYVLGTVEFGSAAPDEAALISVPPYHIAAVANVITNLYAGRRVIFLEQFTPAQWLGVVRAERVTNALMVPTMLSRVLESGDVDLSVPSFRTLAYGGAPMPVPVIERGLRAWPNVDFVNAYGLTETSSTIAILGPEDHRAAIDSDDPAVRARLSSAGRVLPTIELEIRDIDGTVLGPGAKGRIWVRGDQVSAEYLGDGARLDEQGFFDTRDEGSLDERGYLFITGRTDDTIIRGGENIAPAEIEEVLLRHPSIDDAAVVGLPDEDWGQCIEAAVVLRSGVDVAEDDLRSYVRKTLRGSKTPERVWFWTELPRTETGKLIRRQIVSRLLAEHRYDTADTAAEDAAACGVDGSSGIRAYAP